MKRKPFYEDLTEFTLDWLKQKNKEGEKPQMSEIVGGLEMVKHELYWTQSWFIQKVIKRNVKDNLALWVSKLAGKEITISSDGSISIIQSDIKGESEKTSDSPAEK